MHDDTLKTVNKKLYVFGGSWSSNKLFPDTSNHLFQLIQVK